MASTRTECMLTGFDNELSEAFVALENAGATLEDHRPLFAAIVKNPLHADNLPGLFRVLSEAGATLDAHYSLFFQSIPRAEYAVKLAVIITLLCDSGLTNPNIELCNLIFKNVQHLDGLTIAYKTLDEAGFRCLDYPALYLSITRNAHQADKLPMLFEALTAVGATVERHRTLFEAVIFSGVSDSMLPFAVSILQNAGANPDEHQAIYQAVIEQAFQANNLAPAFAVLSAAGITVQAQPILCELVIKDALATRELYFRLIALNDMGLSYQEQPELYELVIHQTNSHCISLLERLQTLGFKTPDDLDLMLQVLLSDNLDLLLWLEAYGFNKNDHYFIFENFFIGDKALIHSPYAMAKVKVGLNRLLDERPQVTRENDSWSTQCEQMQEIIDLVRKADNQISEGPLYKSEASWQIEFLLKRIAAEDIDNLDLRFDESAGYILQFNGEPEIYLTELLKLANFNHVELSAEQVDLLGDKIQAVAPGFNSMDLLSNSCISKKLPDAARRAFTCYVDKYYYMNINRLFRGVAQTTDDEYAWIKPVEERPNLIANFLTGCLMNWSAVALPHLLHDSVERQLLKRFGLDSCNSEASYDVQLMVNLAQGLITECDYNLLLPLFPELVILFPKYGLVDRGDYFSASEQNELCTIKRLTANMGTFTPALLSLSVFPQGHKHFHATGCTATKVETDNSTRVIISSDEGEIIIPHGTSFCYAQDTTGTLFAREVNSPGIVPNGGYWSSNALAEAFRNHLSKPYADDPGAQITINNIRIERPNQGLAHCYRKMVYIDIVIDYFAHHAADPAFRLFCQSASPEEREWLRVTMAYSVTGREKEASMANMEGFLDKYPPANPDEAMRERMLHCMRWLENPDYEHSVGGPTDESEHRNFIHRILCVAHNLDQPRCQGPDQCDQDLAICRHLSVESPEQNEAYTRMVDYAIELIRAHGDSVGNYQAPFDKVSGNLRQVREVTESVTRPGITEPYQFTTPHPQPFSP